MKKFTTCLLASCLIASASAQISCDLKVSGRLLHAADSSGISGAEVFVEKPHVKTKSDPDGYFLLKRLCPGQILLEIDLGEGIHIHHFLETQGDTHILIYIIDEIIPLKQAEILRRKTPSNQISREDLQNRAGSSIATQLEALPGIQILKNGQTIGKPVAEGFTGLRLPVFVNGIRLESQQWGNDHSPEIDGLGYDRIRRITGAVTLSRAHDALGGLIEINSFPDAHYGELDITGGAAMASNGRQATGFVKASGRPAGHHYGWHANSSLRRSGNYRSPDYYLHNTGLLEAAINGGISGNKNNTEKLFTFSAYHLQAGIFSGSRNGSIPDLLTAISRSMPLYGEGSFTYSYREPMQATTHLQSGFEIKKTNSRFLFSLQFNNRREYDYHRSSRNTFPQLDLYLGQMSAVYDHNTAFLRHKSLRWGLSAAGWMNRYAGYFFIPDLISGSSGAYVIYQKPLNGWLMDFALRGDLKMLSASWLKGGTTVKSERLFGNISSGISLTRGKGKHQTGIHLLKLWRSPWINELYSQGVHHASAAFESGNPMLRPEHDLKGVFEHTFYTGRWYLQSEMYFNYVYRYINLIPAAEPVLTVRGAFPAYVYDQRSAIFTGADINASYLVTSRLRFTGRGTYTYALHVNDKSHPAYIPISGFSSEVSYRYKNIFLKAEHRYFARQIYYTAGTDYLPPPAAYSLINLFFSAKNIGRGQHFSFNLEVNNLLNKKYRDYLDRFRYFADMQGRNIQLRLFYNFHHHYENHLNK